MASIRLYPLELPAALVEGHGFVPESNARERARDQGEMRMRPRFRRVPELAAISWLYEEQAQFDTFDAWYENELKAGTLDFDVRVQDRGTEFGTRWYTAQFVGDYRCEVFDELMYRVTGTVRLVEDIGTLRIPPGIEATIRVRFRLTAETVAPSLAATIVVRFGLQAVVPAGPMAAVIRVSFGLAWVLPPAAGGAARETEAGIVRETDMGIIREIDVAMFVAPPPSGIAPWESLVQLLGTFSTGVALSVSVGPTLIGTHTTVAGDVSLVGAAAALTADINARTGTTGFRAYATYTEIEIDGPPDGVEYALTVAAGGTITTRSMAQRLEGLQRYTRSTWPMVFATDGTNVLAYTDRNMTDHRLSRYWKSAGAAGPFILERTLVTRTNPPSSETVVLFSPTFGRVASTTTRVVHFSGDDTYPWTFSVADFDLVALPARVDSDLPAAASPVTMASDGSRVVLLAANARAYASMNGQAWTDLGAIAGATFPKPLASNNCTLWKVGSRWFLVVQNFNTGEVNANVIFYNDNANPTSGWVAAPGQPAFTRASANNVHEEIVSDGTGLYLFVNISFASVWVFKSTDNGSTWVHQATLVAPTVQKTVCHVQVASDVGKLRVHFNGSVISKTIGASSWDAGVPNSLNEQFYGVTVDGVMVMSDKPPAFGLGVFIKSEVGGNFTETPVMKPSWPNY